MRIVRPAIFGLIATSLVSGLARAETVPSQLRNKTIFASWRAEWSVMTPHGERQSPPASVGREIYISGTGRFFVRGTIGSRSAEAAPGEKAPFGGARDLRYSGGKLIGLAQHGQGAGRMIIDFDPGFSSCRVHLAYGNEAGHNVTIKNRAGVKVQLLGARFSGESCSIHAGNVFAN